MSVDLFLPDNYRLPSHPEATELVTAAIAPDDGAEVRLTPAAAVAWQRLAAAARHDGVIIWPLSGFRTVQRQTEIIREKLSAGQTISEILQVVAAPGYSEHHSGRALDVGSPDEPLLDEGFAATEAYRWMRRRAAEFGFHLSYPPGNPYGIRFEPWHWCYASDS